MQVNQNSEKFIVRMPTGLREQLRALACANRRSMNAEVVFQLERLVADREKQKAETA
ncbi:hypothetical protein SRABI05_00624 [Agrobacterium fabrum]|uniref:Arc family DNA-binding protein n=1 Tax=Agrobacterium fabrum TaxID=1176649 RepID=UPI001E01D739|nr:hypothetical protein SRABI05_00624 [Agrobacterium fabrum]CAH0173856.1 hypothetical protein SRABI46_01338 [Agrobacterium fabrum]